MGGSMFGVQLQRSTFGRSAFGVRSEILEYIYIYVLL